MRTIVSPRKYVWSKGSNETSLDESPLNRVIESLNLLRWFAFCLIRGE